MKDKIIDIIKSRKILMISSIVFGVFMVVVLPMISYINQRYIGVSFSPDTSFFYTSHHFYQMIDLYGDQGRNLYIIIRWTFDLIYPLVYGLFLIMVLYHVHMNKSKAMTLLWFPLLGVIFDYGENIVATILIGVFPKQLNALVYMMQVFSLLKWLFIGLSLVMIFYQLYRMIRQKQLNQSK